MADQPEVELSAEQNHVLDVVASGSNVFITGPGGTGKSTVIREIQEMLGNRGKRFFLTAPTGIAALNIGGSTLHSFCGAGLAQGTKEWCLKEVQGRKKNVTWWQQCQVLIIDEVSMLDPVFFEKLDFIAKGIRKSVAFFGGIQVVAVGDFFQLPPVNADRKKVGALKPDDTIMEFVFEHPLWIAHMKRFVMLTQVHRQKDLEFVHLLSQIRHGELSEAGCNLLKSRINAHIDCPEGLQPTRLFATRAEADKANRDSLAALPGEEKEFVRTRSSMGIMSAAQKEYLWKKLDDNCQADTTLKLKQGAQVLLLVNLATEEGLVNGSRGVVVRFDEESGWPVVRFATGNLMLVRPFDWIESSPDRKWQVSLKQVPLKLAYGITIHKSQSLTIDLLSICLSRVFEYGQVYVALSRARTLAGLRLEGDFDATNMAPHPKVVVYYNSLQTGPVPSADPIPEPAVTSIKRARKITVIPPATTKIRIPKSAVERKLEAASTDILEKYGGAVAKKPECVICLDQTSTHLISPCGHKCVCADCSEQLKDCPLCRNAIERIIRVFE